ncbi:MAG: response regulator [Hydrogenophilaceae bacterium]|nr:response regulator [Hydrogenophilaceae bacterium]
MLPTRLADIWADRGLLLRVAIGQGLLLLIIAVLMSGLLAYQKRSELLEDQQNRARLMLLVLTPLVAEQALIGDYASIKQLLERQAAVYPDIARMRWQRNGQQAVTVRVNPPMQAPPAWFRQAVAIPGLERSTPVSVGGAEYGNLQISFDSTFIAHELWQELTVGVAQIFVSAVLLLAAMMLMLRANLRVLRDIAGAVDRFRQGEYTVRIRPAGAREMRQAVAIFNNMAERIQQLLADVSDSRRKLHEQLHFIEELIEALPLPMFYKDRQGLYLGVNEAWEAFFGVPRQDILGRKVRELYPQEPDIAAIHEAKDAELLASRGVQSYEIDIKDSVGDARRVMYTKTALTNAEGQVTGLLGIITDLTELNMAEQRARQALVDKSAAEKASQSKSMFLANMSHEIRTPLNAVLGLAQVGVRGTRGRKAQDTFSRILEAGQLLLSVVNDILDYSKIEAGKLVVDQTPFAIGEAIDRAVGINAPRAFAKGLEFHLCEAADVPQRVVGDEMHLSQILVNLLGNAVKFTDRGHVAMTVATAQGPSGQAGVLFSIEDTGIGMSEEQMATLFLPFEQADGSTTRRFGGTGLGLSISHRLILAMGGEIGVESQLGQGTLFTVWLPLAASPDQSAQPEARLCFGLLGFGTEETDSLVVALAPKGVDTLQLATGHAGAIPATDLIVVAGEALAQPTVESLVTRLLQEGRRLAVVAMPGAGYQLPDAIQEHAIFIERPLRVRHLLEASRQSVRPVAEPLAKGGRRLAGLRVLAAEDNEVNQIVLEEILSQEGAVLTLAGNGREALEKLQQYGAAAFDILLTDVQMPEMDGYGLARAVSGLFPALPIIGLTAHAMAEERGRCLAAGMREHVAKPIDIEVLVAAILQHTAVRPDAWGGLLPGAGGPAVAMKVSEPSPPAVPT